MYDLVTLLRQKQTKTNSQFEFECLLEAEVAQGDLNPHQVIPIDPTSSPIVGGPPLVMMTS